VATITGDKGKAAAIRERGAEVLLCRGKDGRVDLQDMLVRLGRMNVQSLLLEGGSTLAGEALRLGLIDKALLFYAPKLVGGEGPGLFAGMGIERMDDAIRLKDVRFRRFAEDIMIEGYPEMSCSPV